MGYLAEALVVAVVLLIVLPILSLYIRRRVLSNRGGVFDCGLRADLNRPGWMLGLARYEGESLEWYRVFSISLKPKLVISRGFVEILGRRLPNEIERVALFEPSEVVRVRLLGEPPEPVELAMSPESVTGMMSWIEAGPRMGSVYPGGE